MEQERRSLRVGLAVIACAAVLRLLSSGVLLPVLALLQKPEVASFLLYLETGRVVRDTPPVPAATQTEATQPPETLPVAAVDTTPTIPPAQETTPPPAQETPSNQERPCFTAADAQLLELRNETDYKPDLKALLCAPLTWDLTGEAPTVLIVHTHATESYRKNGETYQETAAYRTLDEGYNMLAIGDAVARQLEARGIRVIHDRSFHDYPTYTGSYGRSRKTIRGYLEKYPSITVVLDLHRDAFVDDKGQQLSTKAQVEGKTSAQLMMVVGTDTNLSHPDWEKNMAVAAKLHVLLEKAHPGLCRPISFRCERFNQDMVPGCLLVEVGAAGNTQQEALRAAGALAEAIAVLSKGAATANSTS